MRLDIFLKDRENISRTKATRYIENGQVFVNGKIMQKSAYIVSPEDKIEIQTAEVSFVSQGGYKLYKALQTFQTTVQNKIFVDIGASTGGFTDCLLQFGAKKVYAVDVGKNQLDTALKNDDRIVILDECNARMLTKESFADILDGCVVDVSFISLKHIFPVVANLLEDGKELYALIKPQFETESKGLDKHGIIKEKSVRHSVIQQITEIAEKYQFYLQDITTAPIVAQKNIEYIAYFQKNRKIDFELQKKLYELN